MKDPDIDLLIVRCRQLLRTKTMLTMTMLVLDMVVNLMMTVVIVTIMLILEMMVNMMKMIRNVFFYDCLFRERLTDAGDREEKPESRTDQQVKRTDFLHQVSIQHLVL